jgi:hypothetical protein
MQELEFTGDFLRQLIQKQVDAANRIPQADAGTAGLAEKVRVSHGAVCAGAWPGMTRAEAERKRAIDAMTGVSEDLAEGLRETLATYEGTDSQAATTLNKTTLNNQVRPE